MQLHTADPAPRERLAGAIERVTFHSEQSGFCVLRIKVRGQRDLMTVIGNAASVSAGESIEAQGRGSTIASMAFSFVPTSFGSFRRPRSKASRSISAPA
jgi:hypothetical protein